MEGASRLTAQHVATSLEIESAASSVTKVEQSGVGFEGAAKVDQGAANAGALGPEVPA